MTLIWSPRRACARAGLDSLARDRDGACPIKDRPMPPTERDTYNTRMEQLAAEMAGFWTQKLAVSCRSASPYTVLH